MTSVYHSVGLQESSCKGCTICVTACPVEAIRVHDGKAHILEKQCIDCGECIRQCPNHAKYATSADLAELKKYTHTIALAAPAWYAQFDEKYPRRAIRAALQTIGFTAVYDVADAAAEITKATASYMSDFMNQETPDRPVISSSCPAVVKLIQIRFPTLIPRLLPLIPPAELAARIVRSSQKTTPEETTGIFFISPCPAKMTLASSPIGHKKSEIDGAFGISTLYLPVLNAIKTLPPEILNPESPSETDTAKKRSQIWCTASGEAECLEVAMNAMSKTETEPLKWMNVSGIPQTLKILSAIEDGILSTFDFIEIDACNGGCLGGALTIQPSPVAESAMRRRIRSQNTDIPNNDPFYNNNDINTATDYVPHLWDSPVLPRPVRLLSNDFTKARKMMQEIEDTLEQLPDLDCGCCGAPNCRALAEDIVRHNAHIEDCVTILKARYEEMLFGKKHEPNI